MKISDFLVSLESGMKTLKVWTFETCFCAMVIRTDYTSWWLDFQDGTAEQIKVFS